VFGEQHNDLQVQTTIQGLDSNDPLLLTTLGYNKYALDLSDAGIASSGNYIIEVTNDKKEKYYLRFAK